MYRIKPNENFIFLNSGGGGATEKSSKERIATIENMVKQKEKELEEMQYTLDVFKREWANVIKSNIYYYWWYDNDLENIQYWLDFSKTKYDKRKKYPQKENFDSATYRISHWLFGDRDIEITETMHGGWDNYTDIVVFQCEGLEFHLSIPKFKNIYLDNIEYAHYGKLEIAVRDSSCSYDVIASDYDEDEITVQINEFFKNTEEIERIKNKLKNA